jgi:farnesyl diphosphate synthase
MTRSLDYFIKLSSERTERLFEKTIKSSAPALQEAMRYAVLNGGKRLRPLLVYITGGTLGASLENLDAAACAIELIHAYSLIHDDLPAMDNADFRRGKPSCHKAYGEATAILAGDALQPLAFELIATHPCTLTAEQRLQMIALLSKASGGEGMAAGQALDLSIPMTSLESLNRMYQLKTGALLVASIELGFLSAGTSHEKIRQSLVRYAECIGLAFQLQDDLLDVEGSLASTGKPAHLDATNQKITYPTLIGIEKTRQTIQTLLADALRSLTCLGEKGYLFHELADFLLQRNH